jgi:hypothetical protein
MNSNPAERDEERMTKTMNLARVAGAIAGMSARFAAVPHRATP